MGLRVDTYRCKLCGACQEIDPDTFEVDEKAGELTVREREHPDPGLLEQAAAWCPAHCIEVTPDDPPDRKDDEERLSTEDYEKGMILQKDRKSYAMVPHFPLGIMTPEECRRVADAAEKYNVSMLKITSSMRLALIGVAPENVHDAWAATGMQAGAAKGPCIRSIRACPGTEYCRLAKQDALKLGMELDARYHGMSLPAKLKIAVSGCVNQCAENCIRDIGLHGKNDGWVITIGGNGGARPSLAQPFASGLDDAEAMLTVDKLIKFYSEKAKKFDRMSKLIKRTGIENIKKAIDLRD